MQFLTITATIAITGLATAQSINDIPTCAIRCFEKGIAASGCSLTDYYCQCTTGSKVITDTALQCLCSEEGTSEGCSAAELLQAQQASNKICVSALSASSQTYTPQSIPTNYCQTHSGSGSSSVASASASATGTGSAATSSGSGTATAASTSSSSSTGAGASSGKVGYEGALLGLAGIALLAL